MEGPSPGNGPASQPRRRGGELATEAERTHTPRTPVRTFAGVWMVIAVVVAIVVALAFIAYFGRG